MSDRRFSFEFNRTSSAPPEVLFRLETDGAGWSTWAGPAIVQSSWEREGDPAPAGIGAVRKVGLWPVLMREQTIEYEQDRRHVYTFVGGGPAKDYRAEVLFTPNAAGGTDLTWTGTFSDGAIPGTGPVVLAIMRLAIKDVSKRLVKAADREVAGPPK
ncbi:MULTISPECIES: SRPBCC family protein [unclassified Mycobacterium]|uniref:SRPBCC family protein n=1 Tax=unclassified Mycobacterium TaxID=2642494 RepID=UPI0029C833C4|nr:MULTISPECIES: SRPBCC family protein [unclassified Mycobacterium]